MLFKRRHKLPIVKRVLGWLWPRSGLWRAMVYYWHRIARLPDTPHRIAAGLASGAAVSFTPFLGLHFALAILVSSITRGNFIAALVGTIVGNPWTFPFIFTLTSKIGEMLVGGEIMAEFPEWSFEELFMHPIGYLGSFLPGLKPLIIGSIPAVLFVWAIFYFSFKALILSYKMSRLDKLKQNELNQA